MKHFKGLMMMAIMVCMIVCLPIMNAQAKVKTYKAKKVTAQQIAIELKKICPVKKIVKYKPDKGENYLKYPNAYKSKYNFYDKKYKSVYSTIEVFADNYDAAHRQAYIDCLKELHATFEWEEGIPLQAYRFKNVVIRVSQEMPLKRVLQYYNALKKIVK